MLLWAQPAMPDLDVDRFRRQLLESGVAPRHVGRVVAELSDHLEDLEIEAMRQGRCREEARADAIERFGDVSIIADHVLSRPEFKCWLYRFPHLARIVLPIAYLLVLPAAPIYAGVAHAPTIGRWCACLIVSGLVTSGMMLMMQIAITLS